MGKRLVVLVSVIMLTVGCANRAAQAPVPGSRDTLDAHAFRVVADTHATLIQAKTWEVCSDKGFPVTIEVEPGLIEVCDPKSTTAFPGGARPLLFTAEKSYNLLRDSAKAYHDGTGDAAALNANIARVTADIIAVLTSTGGK